jgi:hypothetical protein
LRIDGHLAGGVRDRHVVDRNGLQSGEIERRLRILERTAVLAAPADDGRGRIALCARARLAVDQVNVVDAKFVAAARQQPVKRSGAVESARKHE